MVLPEEPIEIEYGWSICAHCNAELVRGLNPDGTRHICRVCPHCGEDTYAEDETEIWCLSCGYYREKEEGKEEEEERYREQKAYRKNIRFRWRDRIRRANLRKRKRRINKNDIQCSRTYWMDT